MTTPATNPLEATTTMTHPLPRVLVPHPHVRVDATVLDGSPHVEGSRVPVRRLWAWHRAGTTVETLCRRYPTLGPAKILDAIAFAYDNADVIQADVERGQALLDAHETRRTRKPNLNQLQLPFAPSDDASLTPVSPQALRMPLRAGRPAQDPRAVRAVSGRR
jgi:uncharacterized protein (DUF433 family)